MLNEIILPLPNYPNRYWVSNLGYISNRSKRLSTYTINSGYECLKLTGDTGTKSYLLHRLIAEVFMPNPQGKAEVNHIDGDKSNCAVSNLEWVTSAENKAHAKNTGLWKYNVPTLGLNKGKTSIFHNVTWDKSRSKWCASVRHQSKTWFQRRFDLEEDAALHVNWILDELGLNDRPRNVISKRVTTIP